MVNNFRPLGIPDQQIGLIGMVSVVAQCALSILFGLIADRLKHQMKLIILTLLAAALGSFVWLLLMCLQILPHSLGYLYIAVILASSMNFSCNPLFFEMTAEIAYPLSEGLVAGFLTAVGNLIGVFFL